MNQRSHTCFALIKMQERAWEMGYMSPFDPSYEYSDEITEGWEFIFDPSATWVVSETLSLQDHTAGATGSIDNPDTNGNGYGVHFWDDSDRIVYATGICLVAMEAGHIPDRPNEGGMDIDGDGDADTYGEIAQEAADWLSWAQADSGAGEGGFSYDAADNAGVGRSRGNTPDQSNTGYGVMGLAAAEALGRTVPNWVRTEVNVYIGSIQDPVNGDANDGGSWYRPAGAPDEYAIINELKTGNLIFEMTWYGDDPGTQRFQDALDYIERHWRDPDDGNYSQGNKQGWGYGVTPASYQAQYCLMRGLEFSDIDLLDADGDGQRDDDWYNQQPSASEPEDFASAIIAEQNPDGSWPGTCHTGNALLCTTWALLTLEKIVPRVPSSIQKVSEAEPVPIGETTVFTFTASLPGGDTLYRDATLTDTLSMGLGYISSTITVTYDEDGDDGGPGTLVFSAPTTAPAQYDTGQMMWDVGNITGTATIKGIVTTVVRDVTSNQDGITLPNTITMVYQMGFYTHTREATAEIEVSEPTLGITRGVESSTGSTQGLDGTALLTYTIRLENSGSTPARSVYVTETVPAGIGVVALYGGDVRSGPVAGPDVLTWYIATVEPGTTVLTYTARITQATSNTWLTSTAEAIYHSAPDTQREARMYDAGNASVSIQTGALSVSKAVEPASSFVGDNITYTLALTVPAGLVGMGGDGYLRDELPMGVWYITGSETITWTPLSIPIALTGGMCQVL